MDIPVASVPFDDMGRRLDVDQLVGASEIAERLHLSSVQRVHELRARNPDFPAPVVSLKQALVFYWPEVERWAEKKRRERDND